MWRKHSDSLPCAISQCGLQEACRGEGQGKEEEEACKLLVLHDNLGVVTLTVTRDPVRLDDWVRRRDGECRPEERREAMTGRDLRKACQDAEITALLLVSFRLERMRPPAELGNRF